MALTVVLQIATRITCIPTTAFVISSYSNVRLQQPSMDSSMSLVKGRMVSDLDMIVPSNDEPATTTQVIDKIESDESELKKLNNDKFAGIEILETTARSGSKGQEEELLVAKTEEKIVENVTKSSELIVEDIEEITTEVPTTTVSEAEDENQPTTVEPTF